MNATSPNDADRARQIRLTRVYGASVQAVWQAWAQPEQIARWWGPRGFTLSTHSKTLRAGGQWRYTMHGPDGTDYPNVATYHVVEPERRLVYDHGATDATPPLFRVEAIFSEAQGGTTLALTFTFATPEMAQQIGAHIRQAGGEATWDRLAEHLHEAATGQRIFVMQRSLAAPRPRVFAMWTQPDPLARWLPPQGCTMRFLRPDIAVGHSALFVIEGDAGALHVKADYLAIEPPQRLCYLQQFVDAHGHALPTAGEAAWPAVLRTTASLAQESADQTRVSLTCEPQGQPTAAEIDAFVRERPGMTAGWSRSFDALEALLEGAGPGH